MKRWFTRIPEGPGGFPEGNLEACGSSCQISRGSPGLIGPFKGNNGGNMRGNIEFQRKIWFFTIWELGGSSGVQNTPIGSEGPLTISTPSKPNSENCIFPYLLDLLGQCGISWNIATCGSSVSRGRKKPVDLCGWILSCCLHYNDVGRHANSRRCSFLK